MMAMDRSDHEWTIRLIATELPPSQLRKLVQRLVGEKTVRTIPKDKATLLLFVRVFIESAQTLDQISALAKIFTETVPSVTSQAPPTTMFTKTPKGYRRCDYASGIKLFAGGKQFKGHEIFGERNGQIVRCQPDEFREPPAPSRRLTRNSKKPKG